MKALIGYIKVVGYFLGNAIIGIGLVMVVPLAIAVIFKEINPSLDFCIGIAIALCFGSLLRVLCKNDARLRRVHAIALLPLVSLVIILFGAIPLYLSAKVVIMPRQIIVEAPRHFSQAHNFWRYIYVYPIQAIFAQPVLEGIRTARAGIERPVLMKQQLAVLFSLILCLILILEIFINRQPKR